MECYLGLLLVLIKGYRFHLYQKARTLKKVEEEARIQKELVTSKEPNNKKGDMRNLKPPKRN